MVRQLAVNQPLRNQFIGSNPVLGAIIMKRNKNCVTCNTKLIRIDEWDAYACKSCCKWTEAGCSEEECQFCRYRPLTPINVNWDDEWNT